MHACRVLGCKGGSFLSRHLHIAPANQGGPIYVVVKFVDFVKAKIGRTGKFTMLCSRHAKRCRVTSLMGEK